MTAALPLGQHRSRGTKQRLTVKRPPVTAVAVYCDGCPARLAIGATLALKEGTAVMAGMEGWRNIVGTARYGVFHGTCPRCQKPRARPLDLVVDHAVNGLALDSDAPVSMTALAAYAGQLRDAAVQLADALPADHPARLRFYAEVLP